MKSLVMGAKRGPVPVYDLPLIIEQPAEFDAHRPAPFIFAFLADLLRTASLTDRKEPFDRITVDHGEETGSSQQAVTPRLVSLEQPLQAGAFRQTGEQVTGVPAQPAIKGREMPAFE